MLQVSHLVSVCAHICLFIGVGWVGDLVLVQIPASVYTTGEQLGFSAYTCVSVYTPGKQLCICLYCR